MDQMLKQRLIGGIVIIALAVIFIPMLLEGPDKEVSPGTQNMPPPPAIDYQTEVELPVPAAPADSAEPAETPEAPAAPEQEVSALPEAAVPPAEPAPAPVKPVEKAAPPPSPEKAAPRTASPADQGGWVLQVGSFTQEANARSLRDRLKKAGYQASVQVAKSSGGTIHRVLIGPVSDRPAAEKLRDKLAREQKLTAMVLENK